MIRFRMFSNESSNCSLKFLYIVDADCLSSESELELFEQEFSDLNSPQYCEV